MESKYNKFLAVGLVAALYSLAPSTFAKSSEDFVNNNPACTIEINDQNATRFVNVNYIRVLQIEKDNYKKIMISLASNYNTSPDEIRINYQTNEEALKALNNLNDKINDCQYDAAIKRSNRMKR